MQILDEEPFVVGLVTKAVPPVLRRLGPYGVFELTQSDGAVVCRRAFSEKVEIGAVKHHE
jgi:hypothetical protein